jgi:cation:H+ antiporter
MVLNVLLLLIGLGALVLGGDVLVRGASRLALRFNIQPMVVGLTIVAFGTSAPELLVSLNAALNGSPDFALGNVVGSNISNLSLVLGTACLFGFIPINRSTASRDWLVTMGASLLLYLFARDQKLSSLEGAILFVLLLIYLLILARITRKEQIQLDYSIDKNNDQLKDKLLDLFLLTLGGLCLYFGSNWFIDGASNLASELGISERVIGLTVLAIGTSLPELVTSIIAARKGETELALGNLLGSNIFNVLLILGITSIIRPLNVNQFIQQYDFWWMLGLTFGILPLMLVRKRLGTPSGILLLSFYAIYIYSLLKQ